MKLKLIIFSILAFSVIKPIHAQFIEAKDESLVGFYKVKSIKINHEVDLNKDGKKSSDLFDEFNDCQKDITMELLADHTAILMVKTEKCKEDGGEYKWEVVKKTIEERESINGKTVKKMKDKTFLVLYPKKSSGEVVPFEITMISSWNIKLKGIVSGLSDTTEEGIYNFKKTKKQ